MAQVATMNQAQLQILDMLSFIKTPEALRDLNKVISDYFVQMADAELDRMWNEGTLNEERIESFRHLHERTPYNLLAELKNRLKISIFLWRKKLCISLIFSNFVVSNYKVIYFTLCTTCMQIS